MAAMDGTMEEGLCLPRYGPAYLMCSFDPSPAGEMRCVLEKRGNKRQSGPSRGDASSHEAEIFSLAMR